MTIIKSYTAREGEVQRQWYVVDAQGKTLGRLASHIAMVLRGKNKPTFTPHMDTGDFVVVVNAGQVHLTGRKLDQKMYYRHSGYPGGLKEISARQLLAKKPEEVLRHAVRGMLPKNSLGRHLLKKLKIYATGEHPHEAQQPLPFPWED
jgi:large subunit ribosomal protein L13